MTPTYNDLLEDWIIYLKRKGIAKPQSNPDGSLVYTRQPETSDVVSYLSLEGFERGKIRQAIETVTKKEPSSPTRDTSQDVNSDTVDTNIPDDEVEPQVVTSPKIENGTTLEFPGVRDLEFIWTGRQWKVLNKASGKGSKIANREVGNVLSKLATGVEPSIKDLLDARKKLKLFASKEFIGNPLSESLVSIKFSEDQIKDIFLALVNSQEPKPKKSDKENEDTRIEEINRIKSSIRDRFNNNQIKALWRILSNA